MAPFTSPPLKILPKKASSKILFQLSGSIACFKACELISLLVKEGYEVQVVATKSALKFVGTATLEGLSQRKVLTDIFEEGSMMDHIYLSRWADLLILCPATANTLNRLASGLADDLIGSIFLSLNFKKPYLVAPAMNSQMLQHPKVQSSLEQLKSWGVQILPTENGPLACGELGPGRLLPIPLIFDHISRALDKQSPHNKKKILVTGGGTTESIDSVRAITNTSTGLTGALLADELSHYFDVTYLKSEGSITPQSPSIDLISYKSFIDLNHEIKETLSHKHFHTVIHLAAVSDFSVAKVTNSKGASLSCCGENKLSSNEDLSIELKKNFKIVHRLKDYSKNKDIVVVGFKLTDTASVSEQQNSIFKLFESPNVDWVVHNDLNCVKNKSSQRELTLYSKSETRKDSQNTSEKICGIKNLSQRFITLIQEGDRPV